MIIINRSIIYLHPLALMDLLIFLLTVYSACGSYLPLSRDSMRDRIFSLHLRQCHGADS